MCVAVVLVVLSASLSLGGCSHPNQPAYAKPLPALHLTKARRINMPMSPVSKLRILAERSRHKASPVSKRREPTKVSSAKPPPLPLRKPPHEQSVTLPSAGAKGSDYPSASLGAVGQESDAKLKAAQAKAKLKGVDALTQEDIEGLSREQLKELRGY
jgi:hypothetical protein